DLALVALDQLPEGFVVASLGPLHELPVAIRHARLPRKTHSGRTYSAPGRRPAALPAPRSVRLRPVGSAAHVDPERHAEGPDVLHGIAHQLGHGGCLGS